MEGSSSKPGGRGRRHRSWTGNSIVLIVVLLALCCPLYAQKKNDTEKRPGLIDALNLKVPQDADEKRGLDNHPNLRGSFPFLPPHMEEESSRGESLSANSDDDDDDDDDDGIPLHQDSPHQPMTNLPEETFSNDMRGLIGSGTSTEERQNLIDALDLQMPQDEGEEGRLDVLAHLQRLQSFTEEQRSRMRRLTSRGDTRRGDIDRSLSASANAGGVPPRHDSPHPQLFLPPGRLNIFANHRLSPPSLPPFREGSEPWEAADLELPQEEDEEADEESSSISESVSANSDPLDNDPNLRSSFEYLHPHMSKL